MSIDCLEQSFWPPKQYGQIISLQRHIATVERVMALQAPIRRDEAVTKADLIEIIVFEIEEAVMVAQGFGDGFIGDASSDERAQHIVSLLPDHAFTQPPEPKT
jgi:hypothetical protein